MRLEAVCDPPMRNVKSVGPFPLGDLEVSHGSSPSVIRCVSPVLHMGDALLNGSEVD